MFQNQSFSSGSYEDMLSGTTLLPHHNNYSESVGSQNELKFITSLCDTVTMQPVDGSSAGDSSRVVVSSAQLGLVDGDQNMQGQGLSLSLGMVMPSIASVPPFQYQYRNSASFSLLMNNASMQNLKANDTPHREDDEATLHKELRNAECMESVSFGGFYKREGLCNGTHPSMCLNEGQPGFSNTVLNSQYLKAAQELLDEIVSVRKALKQPGLEKQQSLRDAGSDGSKDSDGKSTGQSMQISSAPSASTTNSSSELSPVERQNLLDKKTKLLAMLDEVDKRYRQYCHQMQILVSAFDMVAGCGAAEPYTALALRTISRHFRCLRDAISGQIQATQRSLGEQEGIPRLRNVDQQLRQQKAFQQLGVMRHAWRPQRGLPESSVSILRAWLFEHFLHPYPKDSEKIMLARQTGLTRNQVANWFINARVRLWKPMVEEMYKEEFGDSEMSCNLLSENDTPKASSRDDVQVSDNKLEEESQDNLVTVDSAIEHRQLQISDHEQNVMDSRTRNNKNNHPYSNASAIPINNHNVDGGCCLMDSTTAPAATYDLSEFGNFGSHVSLALELRNCNERSNNQMTSLASSSDADLLDYHLTDPGKQQHKFGNPHLLHEFVV